MKRHARNLLCGLLRAPGLTGLLLRRRRGSIVLCYHRVHDRPDPLRPGLPPARLTEHLSWIGKRFRIVGALEIARDPGGESRRAALTFDDATPDLLTGALPRLQEAGVSATVFAVTGTRVPWTERVHRIPGIDVEATKRRLKRLDPDARDREIAGLAASHGERPDGEELLAPDELGPWRAAGGAVGAHSRTHPILPLCPEETARDEVAGSRSDLAAALGEPPPLFAYPGGAWDERTAGLARDAGFEAAFATGGGWVDASSPRFALPRIDVRPDATVAVLAAEIAGVLPRLRRGGGRP